MVQLYVRPDVHMHMVNSTSYPQGTAIEKQRTSGSSAELTASGAEKATAFHAIAFRSAVRMN